jgi:hypothetical protein
MANAARRAGASIIWLFLPVLAINAKANDVDPLGSVNSFGIPIERRSFDHSLHRYALGDVTYHVPRNYLASVEELTPGRAHGIFLDVLLPDFSGFTPSNAHCFQHRADQCHRDIVRVGLTRSIQPSAEQQIANLKGLLAHSAPQIGRCGFSHYEDASNVQVTRAGFDYLVRALGNQSRFRFYDARKKELRIPRSVMAPRILGTATRSIMCLITVMFASGNKLSRGSQNLSVASSRKETSNERHQSCANMPQSI